MSIGSTGKAMISISIVNFKCVAVALRAVCGFAVVRNTSAVLKPFTEMHSICWASDTSLWLQMQEFAFLVILALNRLHASSLCVSDCVSSTVKIL